MDALAEGHHTLGAAQFHRLDNVAANLRRGGDDAETQLFIAGGGEHRPLHSTRHHGGGEEQTLIERGKDALVRAHLTTETGCGQTIAAALNEVFTACNIAARGGKTAAGVLNKAAHHHICPHIAGLKLLHELAVAVVHHADDVRFALFAEGNQLPDLLHGEAGAGGIALGALNGNELRLFIDGLADSLIVESAIGQEIGLPIGDAVFSQRPHRGTDADHALQGVVGRTHRGEEFIPRQEVGAERQRQGVGAAGDLGTHQRRLGVEHGGVDILQVVPSLVIVAVARGEIEVPRRQIVLLHGGNDLGLVMLGDSVNAAELPAQVLQHLLAERKHLIRNAHLGVHAVS